MEADLERLLDPGYLDDLAAKDPAELRAMRAEAQQVEAKLSYLRRLVQGRLDIVSAELERRAKGASPTDLSALLDLLPQILADRGRPPGPARLPTNLLPPDDEDLTVELDRVANLGTLPELSAEQLEEVSERLKQLEREVSARRRAMFGVIDAVQAELARRYEHGEVGA
jgi:small-conductance mechanosensitive channel